MLHFFSQEYAQLFESSNYNATHYTHLQNLLIIKKNERQTFFHVILYL